MSLSAINIKIISLIVNVLLALVSLLMIIYDISTLLYEPTAVIAKIANRNLNTMAILNIIPCMFNVTVMFYFCSYRKTHQTSSTLFENVKWLSTLLSWTVFFAIFSYFFLADTKDITKSILTHKYNEYHTSTAYRDEVDNLQYELHCCGVNVPEDWVTRNLDEYTPSCYTNYTLKGNKSASWSIGCVEKITEINSRDIKRKSINVFISILILEIAVIGILLYLAIELKKIEKRILKRQQLEMLL